MQLDYKYNPKETAHSRALATINKRKKRSFHILPRTRKARIFLLKRLLAVGAVGALAGIIILLGMVAWFSRDLPDPNKLIDRSIQLSTKIYDRTGTHILYEIHGDQQRTLIEINDIPDNVKNAAISAEDRKFYTHHGFDLKGIFRSILIDIFKGGKAQGGSTITQQFVKNAILTNEKTFTRKIKELVLSYQIEKNFSKDQILQLYFNEIPYGSTAYGVQSASRIYFAKDVEDVSLAEAAILAALPQAPTYYSPWGNHKESLINRQHTILDTMANEGYITKAQAKEAKNTSLTFKDQGTNIDAPHFVMYVKELLAESYDETTIEQGGLKVITTLDFEKQKIAEDVISKRDKNIMAQGASNAAMVSLDAKTGEILAMVGSKDYFNKDIDGNVNVVLRKRQPGSSFKPIVYAAAMMKGFTPQTTVYDVATNFAVSGNPYIPNNFTGKDYGPVTLKKALAGSLNITAVKVLYLAGLNNVINLAKNLGYTSLNDPERYGLTLVLGGGEVTLLEHASAYTAFAREGQRVEPVAILKVEDRHGKVLQEFKDPKINTVFDPEVARDINSILSDNSARAYMFGEQNSLTLGSRPVAAKTGTTNDVRDAWTIGYTPSVVTGVWVGNNNNTPMKQNGSASMLSAPIWHDYMQNVLVDTPVEQFKAPQQVITGKDMLDGKPGQEKKVKIDIYSGKLASDSTPVELIQEKIFSDIHSILYYVDKNDPRGNAPNNPYDDPQFANWETAVQEWAKKNNIVQETPPTEVDDTHRSEYTPSITIVSPQNNEYITSNTLDTVIQTSAPRGVARVEYYLDTQLLDVAISAPWALHFPLTGNENGTHTLTAKSFDDLGNTQSASVVLNFIINTKRSTIQWSSPTQGATLRTGDTVSLHNTISLVDGMSIYSIKNISWYVAPWNQEQYRIISSALSPSTMEVSSSWVAPSAGRYTLLVQMTDSRGIIIDSERIRVTVE